MVYSGTLLYNFSGGWSQDYFHDTVQDLVRWSNSAQKSGCSNSIVAPKVWAASTKCSLPRLSMCLPPNFLMTSIPRRLNPNGLLFTTSMFVFKGFLLVTVKVMLPTPWLKRHFLPAVRIVVRFFTSGRHNFLLTTDEEQPESTNTIRSIPLTLTFITGSTSSSLCGERVVLISRPLSHFLGTSMPHDLVACIATAFCLSGVEGQLTGTWGKTRPTAAATGSSTSTSSVIRARALARICSRVMCSILEDPCNCHLTRPGSPDTKAQLSHQSEVFSLIRCARSCRSPKYSSTVSLGCKQRETNVSNATKGCGARAMRGTCFTCCKSSL